MSKTISHQLFSIQRLLLFLIVMGWSLSSAAQLFNVDIEVVINDLGHARICESRTVNVDRGTEGYIKMYDLQGRDVGELSVSDETGREFTPVNPWIVNGTLEDKAYKCGIYMAEKGKELCWGIGSYGHHTHNVHYTLTRLVKSYTDYDGFIFTFYQAAAPYAQNMHVTIKAEGKTLTTENTRVWSFKHYGTIYVTDGVIDVKTTHPFQSDDEKMTVMVQFNKGLLHPTTTVNNTFYKAVKRKALRGSDYLDTEEMDAQQASKSSLAGLSSGTSSMMDVLMLILLIILAPVILIATPVLTMRACKKDKTMHHLFGNVKGKADNWFRGIPCNGLLNHTAGIYFAIKGKKDYDALRKAYILRMIYAKQLTLVNVPGKKGGMQKMFLVAKPEHVDAMSHDYGENLHRLLYKASGDDHVLEPNELKTYVQNNTKQLVPLAKSLKNSLQKDTMPSLMRIEPEDAQEVFGLKKYLEEFTLSKDRTMEEVALWKEYLVHATLFGITDQVSHDMQKVMPDFGEIGDLNNILIDPDTLALATALATATGEAYKHMDYLITPRTYSSRSSSSSRSYSSSSGGGGHSSYSGGGGSGYR